VPPQSLGVRVPERIGIDGELGCRVVRVATRPPAGAAFGWSRRLSALLVPARRLGAGRPRPLPRVAHHRLGGVARIGWEVSLAAGSLGSAGEQGHAPSFFSGVDVVAVDYSPARRLADPTAAIVPFQPSCEDRPGAPDCVFAAVDDEAYERLVAAWSEALARA
jgi:hypothetical protein